MGLETATTINQLDATNPLGSDQKSQGDDHLRLIKSTLKNTFSGFTGALSASNTQLDKLNTTISINASAPAGALSVDAAGKLTIPGDFRVNGNLEIINPLSIGGGGTSASTAAGARTNLGLGTAAVANTGDFVSSGGGTYGNTFNFTGTLNYGGIEVGYRTLPQNVQAGAYAITAADRGKGVVMNSGSNLTVNASVFAGGDVVTIVNNSGGSLSIVSGTGAPTLRLGGTGTTGNRTLANNGIATIYAVTTSVFIVSGTGVS